MKINAFRIGLVGTLGVGVGLLILISIVNLSTVITYIGAALFLSLGLDPVIVWLEKRGMPRAVALLIVMVTVVLVLLGLVWAVVPIVVSEVSKLVNELPGVVRMISNQDWINSVQQQVPWLDLNRVVSNVTNSVTSFLADPTAVTQLAGGVFGAIFAFGSAVFGAVIVAILTLYFTASLGTFKRAGYQLVPASRRERFVDLTEQITDAVGRFVVGQIVLAAINGVLSFIFLSIIQAPFPALLAVVAFLLSLIPLVGTLSGSVIIVLVCLLPGLGSPLTALVAGIYYLIYMQLEAYVLSPNIMNRAVQVPGAVVVVAALAGGALLGVLGALIAIPIAASALLIVKQVVIPMQAER